MAAYTCSLELNQSSQVVTQWNPPKPDHFSQHDQITFTSQQGVWRVEFINSPFGLTPEPQTFSASAGQSRTDTIAVAEGDFPFDCILVVNGRTIGYEGDSPGDDITVGT